MLLLTHTMIKNVKHSFFIVCINLNDQLLAEVKSTVLGVKLADGKGAFEEQDLDSHSNYHDLKSI